MADFAYWFLLVVTAGSLVQVASTVMRRSPSCEEQLQAVSVDPVICERIRSAASSVRGAVLNVNAKVNANSLALLLGSIISRSSSGNGPVLHPF